MKKRLLAIILMLSFVMLLFVACESNTEYAKAVKLIKQGKYNEAYELLLTVGDYKDAQELLDQFYYVPTSISIQYKAPGSETESKISYIFTYNEENLPVQMQYCGADGETKNEYFYDGNGHLTEYVYTCSEYSLTAHYAYDENGYLIRETAGHNLKGELYYEYSYDKNGNVIEKVEFIANEDGAQRQGSYRFTYSSDGKLIKEEQAQGGNLLTTEYTYDTDGKLTHKTKTNNGGQSITYYTYDLNGNLIEEKASDYVIKKQYDENENLIYRETKYLYNSGSNSVYDAIYDDAGKLIREHLVSGKNTYTTEYIYDEDGNLLEKTEVSKIFNDEGTDTKTFIYDQAGNMIHQINQDDDGWIQHKNITYQLVYIPYDLPEIFTDLVSGLISR